MRPGTTPAELEQRRAAIRAGQAISHARARERTAARIEDLEHLYAAGHPLEHAAARVGWSIQAAHSALRRHGHPLARPMSRLVTQRRREAARAGEAAR